MRSFKYLVGVMVLFAGCEPKFDIPEPSAGNADFSSYVAVGTDYSSGFADGALSKEGQLASFPSLLDSLMKLAAPGGDTFVFNIPLLKGDKGAYPGDDYESNAKLTEPKFILIKEPDCKGRVNLLPKRLPGLGDDELDYRDPSQRVYFPGVVFHHIGIPAMKVIHFTSPGYGNGANHGTTNSFNPFFWRIAPELFPGQIAITGPYSSVELAHPTFFTLELGMSDVLSYAISGGTGNVTGNYDDDITSVDDFRNDLSSILDNYLLSVGAAGVIANVPDITTFPYFTTIIYDSLNLDTDKAARMNDSFPTIGYTFHEGYNPFVVKEDGVVRTIKSNEFVLLGIDIDSLKCLDLGAFVPIEDEDILSEAEIESIRNFTAQYNVVIKELADARGLAVVDLAGFMKKIYDETTIDGIDLTAEMVKGAFFSLDGLHPNDRGQALIANEFIKIINQKFGAKLPLLNISEYKGVLFP